MVALTEELGVRKSNSYPRKAPSPVRTKQCPLYDEKVVTT